MKPETYCGLLCNDCSFKESHGCKGCVATKGSPFHGPCPVAQCCTSKNCDHCGQCSQFPCAQLMDYSCDPVHGDDPHGLRIRQCLKWLKGENM